MKNKPYIIAFMLFISIFMLVVPAIPHHHHSNGNICMKSDVTTTNQCCTHHHTNNDTCCSSECLARMDSPAPSQQVDNGPQYILLAVWFDEFILANRLKPLERELKGNYIYRESLHGTNINRAFALRGPPCTFMA